MAVDAHGHRLRGKQLAKVEIESAFVEAWTKNTEQHPAWGMKTAEPHSKKNDSGKYETVGRTFRTVKVSRSSGIDLSQFRKGQRVKLSGSEITESREHEGKTYYDLVVWADSVELADGAQATPPRPTEVPF
jgi:hypothetical protein